MLRSVSVLRNGLIPRLDKITAFGNRYFSSWVSFSHVKSVGIIGAGVAGLQMARVCKELGLECRVFEKAPDVGGLWRENYHSFGIQVFMVDLE